VDRFGFWRAVVDLGAGTATNTGGIRNIQDVLGGAGNDRLIGNAGNNILAGNAGNDTIIAGTGRAILIGGTGADSLTAGGGDDLLIGGSTTYDANLLALQTLLSEWSRTDIGYATRIGHLEGTSGGGNNGGYRLIPAGQVGATVIDDAIADLITGSGGGTNWFIAGATDTIVSRKAGEIVN
jgi:Ca2+-binding RTX toxin-like protein